VPARGLQQAAQARHGSLTGRPVSPLALMGWFGPPCLIWPIFSKKYRKFVKIRNKYKKNLKSYDNLDNVSSGIKVELY
jgi:hypothetical protein